MSSNKNNIINVVIVDDGRGETKRTFKLIGKNSVNVRQKLSIVKKLMKETINNKNKVKNVAIFNIHVC